MKLLLLALILWPGTMLAQSCAPEEKAMQVAAQKLGQCRNKPKELTPEQKYNKIWPPIAKRQQNEKREMATRHFNEHKKVVKDTGFDPDKK